MPTSGRVECALLVIRDELLAMGGEDSGVEIRATGALSLGSRVLSGLCWEERGAIDDD